MTEQRYKFLRLVGSQAVIKSNQGDMTWQIGQWNEVPGQPEVCESGLHCSLRAFDAFSYVHGEVLARVEVDGLWIKNEHDNKEAWEKMRIVRAWRWQKKDSVALAICAAEKVLHLYEARYPDDQRPRKAIEAARAWLENPGLAAAAAAYADADAAAAAAAYADADAAAAAAAAYADADAAAAAYAAYADAADAAAAAAAAAYAAAAAAAYAAAAARAKLRQELNDWLEAYIPSLEEIVEVRV